MTISERVAYIKGLADGMELSAETKEGKILLAVLDLLEDMAYEIEDLNDNQLDIGDELDALSDDLADVEEFVFGLDDDDCCCDDDDDDDCCCCGDAVLQTDPKNRTYDRYGADFGTSNLQYYFETHRGAYPSL